MLRARTSCHPSRLIARFLALAAAGLLVLPSVATAQSPGAGSAGAAVPVSASTAALGQQPAVAVSHQVVVTWSAPALGTTGIARLTALGQSGRTANVSGAAGSTARFVRSFGTTGTKGIYRLADPLGTSAGQTIARIAALPGVVSVEPDPWVTIDALPTDAYADFEWGALGPTDTTNAYFGGVSATYGINAVGVWGTTTGSGVNVGVIDTGWVNHADLAGQSLTGYDFISDPTTANDGDGRDSDPTDPGDFVLAGEATGSCPQHSSTWHGMHVSGTIAALANNSLAGFGAAPGAKIEPIRALGKCGGWMTDITDAITWAYGGTVAGVPANANPVKVINMSLGGTASCPSYTQAAITNARAAGAVVVVAAGNGGVDASTSAPANCIGSLVVAATDIAGIRSVWSGSASSNYGSIVDIAAPGSTIFSTYNSGTTTSVASPGGDLVAGLSGTSMATPHVAAIAALLFAAYPSAQPAAIEYAITHGVTAFAADASANHCTTSSCGAGIANAPAALAALAAADRTPPTATLTAPTTPTNAATLTYTAGFSESVTDLTATDFAVSGTGCVVGTPAGSGASWTVPVTGCGEGPVVLTLLKGSVADIPVGNVGPAGNVVSTPVTVDRTPPTSSGSIAATITNGDSIPVDYSASDTGSAITSVAAYRSTSSSMTAPVICGSVASSAASGVITCTLPATDGTYYVATAATDAAGNTEAIPGAADDSVVRDATAPTVVLGAPSTPTTPIDLVYTVTFSEPVTGLQTTDFTLAGTASCTVASVAGSGASWTATVNGCSGGTVILSLKAGSVIDAASNPGPTGLVTATTVIVDATAPTVSTFALQPGSDTGRLHDDRLTNASSLVFDLVFSEPVTGLDAADFTLAGSTASGCVVAPSGSGTTYTVTVGGCSEGVVDLALVAGAVANGIGNAGPASPAAQAPITIDRTAPLVAVDALPTSPTSSASLTIRVTAGEPLDCGTVSTAADVDLATVGISAFGTVTGAGSTTCSIPATASVGDGQEGVVTISLGAAFSVADDAGNAAAATTGLPISILVDRRAPTVASGTPTALLTNGQPSYALAFSETVTGLAAADLSIGPASSSTGCVIAEPVAVPGGSGAAYTIALSGCSDGTVNLVLAAGAVTDVVGNAGPAAPYPFPTVTIDTTAPTVTAPRIALRTGQRLSGTAVPVTVAWTGSDGSGSGVAAYTLSRSVNGGLSWTTVATTAGTSSTTIVPVTGSVRFKVVAVDKAGNPSSAAVGVTTTALLVQQASAKFGGTWYSQTASAFSGSSVKWAKTRNAWATYTFTGRTIALVSTLGSTRGKARIYVNGVSVGTIDLRASATGYRVVAWQKTWPTSAKRVVKVVVLGTAGRPRVDVDAFVVIR